MATKSIANKIQSMLLHVHGYGDFAVSQQKLKLNKSRGQKEARTSFQIADETRRRFLSSRERRTGSPHWQHKHSRLMFETRPLQRGPVFDFIIMVFNCLLKQKMATRARARVFQEILPSESFSAVRVLFNLRYECKLIVHRLNSMLIVHRSN